MTQAFDNDFASNFPALTSNSTGSVPKNAIARTKVYELGQYEVVLAVTEDDRVVGVIEVRQKKDFRNTQQRLRSTGYIDVEQFVKD
jgi:uncharacterized protein CbrC (UPF0167 family)